MLHLIALPQNDPRLESALKLISNEDDIVVLNRGVDHASSAETLTPLASLISADVHILPNPEQTHSDGTLPLTYIDATKLLALTEKHAACLSWYPDT